MAQRDGAAFLEAIRSIDLNTVSAIATDLQTDVQYQFLYAKVSD
jgi:hypothetical protein